VAAELAHRFGVKAVVITTGAEGCVVHADGEYVSVPTTPVEAVDTTGAGDAFLGGLLAGLHYGLEWRDAARLGNACGTKCCEQIGAFPDGTEETRQRILEIYGRLGGTDFSAPDAAIEPSAGTDTLERFLNAVTEGMRGVVEGIDRASLEAAVELIVEAEAKGGRVHLSGVGKPEHVARYAAGLLSSTGTPATFLPATEAVHGSVGQICEGDVLIAISKSGETEELLACVTAARGMGGRTIAICGSSDSPLARCAELVVPAVISNEGGPLGLAPRVSFLAEAFVLQGLSVLLQEKKELSRKQYHRRHPAGSLGRQASSEEG
jgi:arabinose-5-phosphate isomerase